VIKAFKGQYPTIAENVFIAESADVIGKVTLGSDVSIWFGSVLRGDGNTIRVGTGTNIQDLTMVHVDEDKPTDIGEYVTIGHRAIIHGCTIENNVLIGMGAILLSGSYIEENVIVGAGALVTAGKRMPKNTLVMGSPAKVIRELTQEEIQNIRSSAEHYISFGAEYLIGEEAHEKK
jgi:carbonic anhydrase/acetyltransferase-like protein (isoleucine patch superfamily)